MTTARMSRHSFFRVGASNSAVILVTLVGCVAALCCALFMDRKSSPTRVAAPAVVEREFYFGAFSDDAEPEEVRAALDYIATEIEKRDDLVTLSKWGLDAESLTTKRLYLLTSAQTLQLADDLQTVRELTRGNWNYLSADEFLRRFTTKMRSELADDRYYAVADAAPFVRSLAEVVKPDGKNASAAPNPIAPGLLERLTSSTAKRVCMGVGGKKGVVCALWNDDETGSKEREAAEFALALLDDAQAKYPKVEFDLDFPEAEKVVLARETLKLLPRFALPTLFAALVFGWLVFGGLRRSFATALSAALALGCPWALFARFVDLTPELLALPLGATIAVYAFVAALTWKYAEAREQGASKNDAAKRVVDGLGVRGATTGVGLALLAFYLTYGDKEHMTNAWFVVAPLASAIVASVLHPAILNALEPTRVGARVMRFGAELRPSIRASKRVFVLTLAFVALLTAGAAKLCWADREDCYLPSRYADALRGDRIVEVCGRNSAFIKLTPDSEDSAITLKARCYEESALRVDDVESNLPSATPERRASIDTIADWLRQTPLELGEIEITPQAQLVDSVEQTLDAVEHAQCACVDELDRLALREALIQARAGLEELTPREYESRLGAFASRASVETLKRLFAFRAIADSQTPTTSDLSGAIRERYASSTPGVNAFYVYTTTDVRDFKALQAFATNVLEICPGAGGRALSRFDSARADRRNKRLGVVAQTAASLIFLAVFGRSFFTAASVFAPCAVCALCPLGLFGFFGGSVTPALACAVDALLIAMFTIRGGRGPQEPRSSVRDVALLAALTTLAAAFGIATSQAPGWGQYGKALALGACAWVAAAYFSAVAEESNNATERENG